MTPAPVFISYQRSDLGYAKMLAEAIVRYRGSVWWDRAINPGADWRESIVAALDAASVVVLLHSSAAEKSAEVQKELAIASTAHKTLIAVRLENCPPTGRFLYEMAAINWIEAWHDPEMELDRLAQRLAQVSKETPTSKIAEVLEARPIHRSPWSRIAGSTMALLGIWGLAMLLGLSGQSLTGEGLAAATTENGLDLSDAIVEIVTFLFSPLYLLRFASNPPNSLGGMLVLVAAVIMLACYGLIGRNLWRRIRRWRAARPMP